MHENKSCKIGSTISGNYLHEKFKFFEITMLRNYIFDWLTKKEKKNRKNTKALNHIVV